MTGNHQSMVVHQLGWVRDDRSCTATPGESGVGVGVTAFLPQPANEQSPTL